MSILAHGYLFARGNKDCLIGPLPANAQHEPSQGRVHQVHGNSREKPSLIIALLKKTFPLKKSGEKVSGSGT
jgi:hypothetical protein